MLRICPTSVSPVVVVTAVTGEGGDPEPFRKFLSTRKQVPAPEAFFSKPIDREEFVRVVKAVLLGKTPPIPDYPVCVECKLKENVCMFDLGKFCLGPVSRAGCGAICPTYGDGCEGCRGFIPHPNQNAMKDVLAEAGLTVEEVMSRMTMFNTYQLQEQMAEEGGS